jgi:hypothetical protein
MSLVIRTQARYVKFHARMDSYIAKRTHRWARGQITGFNPPQGGTVLEQLQLLRCIDIYHHIGWVALDSYQHQR